MMLGEFAKFKNSEEYRDIKTANAQKSEEVQRLKRDTDELRAWRRCSYEIERLYNRANEDFQTLHRGEAGVAEASWTDTIDSSPRTSST